MLSIVLISLLAASPEVTIADEHRKDGDPTEIKITLSNKTKRAIFISFEPDWYMDYFIFRLYDKGGRPLELKYTEGPQDISSSQQLKSVDRGLSVTGYLSPKIDFVIPPGRYQVEVVYFYRDPYTNVREEIPSNRITKPFP